MNSLPSFSVLLSLYIKEQPNHLNQCLKSLAGQTVKADEIIIVIDGPITEKLQDILNQWEAILPLKILPQSKNQGLGIALNIGLNACSHEYVFRMDTDDICYKNRFEKQLNYLVNNPDIDILGAFAKEFNQTPGDIKQIKEAPPACKVKSYIRLRNPINHMCAVYKKGPILKIGGYKDLPFMEDYYLWIRAHSNHLKIDNLQYPLVHARVGNGMLDRRRGEAYAKSEKKLTQIKRKYLGLTFLEAGLIYLIRSASRTNPTLLRVIYRVLRK